MLKHVDLRPDRFSPVQLFNPLLYLFHFVLKQEHVQTSFEKICREAIFPAQGMELWLSEQVVTVLAHPVQLCEYRLVVHALALDVEERAFAERVIDARQHGRRRTAAGHPVVAARVVVQVMCGWNRDHGYGHYGQQRGHQY